MEKGQDGRVRRRPSSCLWREVGFRVGRARLTLTLAGSRRFRGGLLPTDTPLRANCGPCRATPLCGAAPPCATSGLPGERRMRNRVPAFAAQRVGSCAGALYRWLSPPAAAFAQVAQSLATNPLRASALFGWRKLDTRSPRLRQTNRNGLLGGSSAVFAFTYMLNFLANEFACLCRGRFTLFCIATGALDHILFWHGQSFRGMGLGQAGIQRWRRTTAQSSRAATESSASLPERSAFATRPSLLSRTSCT